MSKRIYSEKYLERKLGDALKAEGGLSIKLLSQFMTGLPDRMCLLNGVMCFAEIKTTGKRPRPSQLATHELLRKNGFEVFVVDTPEGIFDVIAYLKSSGRGNNITEWPKNTANINGIDFMEHVRCSDCPASIHCGNSNLAEDCCETFKDWALGKGGVRMNNRAKKIKYIAKSILSLLMLLSGANLLVLASKMIPSWAHMIVCGLCACCLGYKFLLHNDKEEGGEDGN